MPPFYKQFALAQTPPSSAPLSPDEVLKNQLLNQLRELVFRSFPAPACLTGGLGNYFQQEFIRVLAHLDNNDLSELVRPGKQSNWQSPYEQLWEGIVTHAQACSAGHFKAICFLFYNEPLMLYHCVVNQQQFVARLHGYAMSAQAQIGVLTARSAQDAVKVTAQSATIGGLMQRTAELEAALTAHTSASTTQLSQLSQLKTSLDLLAQQLAAEKVQTAAAAESSGAQRLEVTRLSGALDAEKDVRVQTQLALVRLQTQLTEVLLELERLKAARAGDEKGAATKKALQTQISVLQQALAGAEARSTKAEGDCKSMHGQAESLRGEWATAKRDLAAAQKKATDAASREAPLKARVLALNQTLTDQTAALNLKGDHVESLLARIAEADAALLLNKQQATDAGVEVAKLKNQVEQLTSKLGPMERSAFNLLGLYKAQEAKMGELETTNRLLQGLLARSGLVQSMDQVELLSKDGPGRSFIGAVLGNRCSEAVAVLDSLTGPEGLMDCLSYAANIVPAHQKASTAPMQLLMEKAATDPAWKQQVCGHRLFQELDVRLCALPEPDFRAAMYQLWCDQDPDGSDSDQCLARIIALEGVGLNGCVGAWLRYSVRLPMLAIHGDGRTVFDLLLDDGFSPVAKDHLLVHMPDTWQSCFKVPAIRDDYRDDYNRALRAYFQTLTDIGTGSLARQALSLATFSRLRFDAFSEQKPLDVVALGRLLALLRAEINAGDTSKLPAFCNQMKLLIPMIADRPGAMVFCLKAIASMAIGAQQTPAAILLMMLPQMRSANLTNATSRPCGPLAQIVAMTATYATGRPLELTREQFKLLLLGWPEGRRALFSGVTHDVMDVTLCEMGMLAHMIVSDDETPKAFYDYVVANSVGGTLSEAALSRLPSTKVNAAVRKLDAYLASLPTPADVAQALNGLYGKSALDGLIYTFYRIAEFGFFDTLRKLLVGFSAPPRDQNGLGLLDMMVTSVKKMPPDLKAQIFNLVSQRFPVVLNPDALAVIAPQICEDQGRVGQYIEGYSLPAFWSLSSLAEWETAVDAFVRPPEGTMINYRELGILFARMVTFLFAFGNETSLDCMRVKVGVQQIIASSIHDAQLMSALTHTIQLLPAFAPPILGDVYPSSAHFLHTYLPPDLVQLCADGGHVASLWVLNAMDLPLLPIPATTDAHSPIVSTLLASLRARHVEG